MNKVKFTIIAILVFSIFSLSIINMNIEKEYAVQTSSNLSNKNE